jgi:hypothetical protein
MPVLEALEEDWGLR